MAILGDSARLLRAPTYTFLRTIVEGNAGETRLYEHQLLGGYRVQKSVSVLGLPDGVANSEPGLLEQLDHAHIIKVREAQWDPDFDESLKIITFTTDYYEGESIHAALTDGHQFSTTDAIGIIDCVLDGLHYVHVTCGIVHRDIKPGNVMLNAERNQGYIGDFGSAAYLVDLDQRVEAAGGTLLYRPPEYSTGYLDARSDLYSTGMTMFELLNGPFDYAALDHGALERRADEGKVTLTAKHLTFVPWVSPHVTKFVRKLMNARAELRFASADEALRALRELRYVDWKQTSQFDWEGRWPPRQAPNRQRLLRVHAEPLRGRFRGQVRLTADWSGDQGLSWRGYARLTRRVAAGDNAALATFFRDVESAAQAVPVR